MRSSHPTWDSNMDSVSQSASQLPTVIRGGCCGHLLDQSARLEVPNFLLAALPCRVRRGVGGASSLSEKKIACPVEQQHTLLLSAFRTKRINGRGRPRIRLGAGSVILLALHVRLPREPDGLDAGVRKETELQSAVARRRAYSPMPACLRDGGPLSAD
jgi:hypothetical protein